MDNLIQEQIKDIASQTVNWNLRSSGEIIQTSPREIKCGYPTFLMQGNHGTADEIHTNDHLNIYYDITLKDAINKQFAV